jgi:hypothetical protein
MFSLIMELKAFGPNVLRRKSTSCDFKEKLAAKKLGTRRGLKDRRKYVLPSELPSYH